MKENRTNPRYKITLNVVIKGIKKDFKAKIVNLSVNGIFLETTQKFPIGSFVEMLIEVKPFNSTIEVLGKIVHRAPKEGVGIEFIDCFGDSKKLLQSLVDFSQDHL